MQAQVLPREIGRGARYAATWSCRSEAIEATINERVEPVRRWRRAMAMGLVPGGGRGDAVQIDTLSIWFPATTPSSCSPP